MEEIICRHCGSTESEIADFKPRDFPVNFFFVQCSKCSASLGVIDFYDLQDRSYRHSVVGRKLVHEMLVMQARQE